MKPCNELMYVYMYIDHNQFSHYSCRIIYDMDIRVFCNIIYIYVQIKYVSSLRADALIVYANTHVKHFNLFSSLAKGHYIQLYIII